MVGLHLKAILALIGLINPEIFQRIPYTRAPFSLRAQVVELFLVYLTPPLLFLRLHDLPVKQSASSTSLSSPTPQPISVEPRDDALFWASQNAEHLAKECSTVTFVLFAMPLMYWQGG